MATLDNATLACLQCQDSTADVTLVVPYDATVSPVERRLAAHGTVFDERIAVVGEDIGRGADLVLHEFPVATIPVSSITTRSAAGSRWRPSGCRRRWSARRRRNRFWGAPMSSPRWIAT